MCFVPHRESCKFSQSKIVMDSKCSSSQLKFYSAFLVCVLLFFLVYNKKIIIIHFNIQEQLIRCTELN